MIQMRHIDAYSCHTDRGRGREYGRWGKETIEETVRSRGREELRGIREMEWVRQTRDRLDNIMNKEELEEID